jgi:S-adenosylmethionine-diacylglycerol 3-amino-3-carboxypropyl transferase
VKRDFAGSLSWPSRLMRPRWFLQPRTDVTRMANVDLVKNAAVNTRLLSWRGLQERAFALAFSGLVYPQIWEDPEVDIRALGPLEGKRLAAIASGGCNLLAYVTEGVGSILAVDLNHHHIALNRLKHAAIAHLPDHAALFRMFGEANHPSSVDDYDRWIAPHLDPETRAYWDGRNLRGRRIKLITRDIYRYGLLGRFITLVHLLARLHGVDPRRIASAADAAERRRFFDEELAPIFDKPLVRWLCGQPSSLYGLGIPPAQFDALSADSGGDMAGLLRHRLERLACGFDYDDNYFAWQAFARRYDIAKRRAVPRYLKAEHFESLREGVGRIEAVRASLAERLAQEPAGSIDRFVLLDAQDWMDDRRLTELWSEIQRTARPGARVIFRTAGDVTILPGRIPDSLLSRWSYEADASRDFHAADRSSIYGGFHLYVAADD